MYCLYVSMCSWRPGILNEGYPHEASHCIESNLVLVQLGHAYWWLVLSQLNTWPDMVLFAHHVVEIFLSALTSLICWTGADEDAATLYGDMAALHLQQQQQLHLEGRPQPAVAPSYVMDEFDSGYGLQALRTPYSSNGSPKHSRLPLAISDIGIASSGLTTSGFPTPSYSTPSPVQPQVRKSSAMFSTTGFSACCRYMESAE